MTPRAKTPRERLVELYEQEQGRFVALCRDTYHAGAGTMAEAERRCAQRRAEFVALLDAHDAAQDAPGSATDGARARLGPETTHSLTPAGDARGAR